MQDGKTQPTTAEPIAVIAYHRVVLVQVVAPGVRDWLAWSIINVFMGWVLLGALPLFFSIICRTQRRRNDVEGARAFGKLALGFNIVVTTVTVPIWLAAIILLSSYPHLLFKE